MSFINSNFVILFLDHSVCKVNKLTGANAHLALRLWYALSGTGTNLLD